MNQLKSVVLIGIRGYRSKSQFKTNIDPTKRIKNAHEKPKKKFTEKSLYSNVYDVNEDQALADFEDKDDLEADFSKVGQSYTEFKREEHYQKELLKMRISARKVNKSPDPNFLTIAERSQIVALNTQDSVEWNPEALSHAFPALPETIKKVLKSKWLPENAKKVIRYDKAVAENWNKFKKGELAVSPVLEEHLKKFKNRKIPVCNVEALAEQYVKAKPNFPVPNSTLFTSLVKDYVDKRKTNDELQTKDDNWEEDTGRSRSLVVANENKNLKIDNRHQTFDSFLEKKAKTLSSKKNLSLSDQVLIEEYKSVKNKAALNNFSMDLVEEQEQHEIIETNHFGRGKFQPVTMNKVMLETSMETGVIEWKRKPIAEDDYPKYIRVPVNKRQSNVTYRVKDCYYDSNGEFLYRTLGIER